MNWKRERPGVYTAGPYRVEQIGTQWWASGPSNAGPGVELDSAHGRKDQAQGLCCTVAGARAGNPQVLPVAGDIVEYAGQRGRISTIMRTMSGAPLYCLALPRGRRQCLLRDEFQVVVP